MPSTDAAVATSCSRRSTRSRRRSHSEPSSDCHSSDGAADLVEPHGECCDRVPPFLGGLGRVDLHGESCDRFTPFLGGRRKRLDAAAEVVELAAQRVGLIVGRRIGDAVRELLELRGELVGDVRERVDALVAAALVVAAGVDARVQALERRARLRRS